MDDQPLQHMSTQILTDVKEWRRAHPSIQTQRMVNTYWHLDVSAHSACPDKRQRVISIAVIEDIVKKTITSAVLSHIIARN